MSHSDNEFKKIQDMKLKLDKVSDSFCLVRWKHATMNLATGTSKSCCHHPFKPISLNENHKQLHDNVDEQNLRSQMLIGKKVDDCKYCWWIEKNGHTSNRQTWSAKPWMRPFYDDVVENLSEKASSPSWVELNFSSVCNLKCVYCSPIFSTKWFREIQQHGPYKTSVPHNDITYLNSVEYQDDYENTELMEEFWPWFEEILPGLRLLKLTGGEPLLSPHTLKMMELMKNKPVSRLTMAVNSNLSISEEKWDAFVDKVAELEEQTDLNRFYLHPSIDSFGKRAEYIRYGLDLDLFTRNTETYLERTGGNLLFICSLNNLALGGLKEFWAYILRLKQNYQKPSREITLTTEIIQYPAWLNINILPDEYKEHLDETIAFVSENINEDGSGFQRVELEGLKKARGSFESAPDKLNTAKKDFYTFILEADRRRKTDFQSTFPELVPFFNECRRLSEKSLLTL